MTDLSTLATLTVSSPAGVEHTIRTWVELHAMIPYAAWCSCGWHAASISAKLQDWNVEGHAKDVRESA